MTTFAIALVGALAATGAGIPVLRRLRLYDVPNERSSHVRPVPRGGGLLVLACLVVAVLAASPETSAWVVIVPALLLAALGFADDLRSLPALPRLVAQAVVAVGACAALATTGGADAAWAVTLVGGFAVLSYVNAFNFMDGVNGISALTATVCGVWLSWLGDARSAEVVTTIGLALAGASLGFLPWNLASRVFLGDVGSYGIGALIALTGVLVWLKGAPLALVVAPAVPYLADTGWTLAKRAVAGRPVTEAHREHVYQRLTDRGWSHAASAAFCAGAAAASCVGAALVHPSSTVVVLALEAVVGVAYLMAPRVAGRRHETVAR